VIVFLVADVSLSRLHPHPQELNWPLGKREALDFTRNKIGLGLRYEIPYHLYDALFYAMEDRLVVPFHESREAMKLLEKIKAVVVTGLQAKLLQRTPHLVLLNTSFYHRELRPLLASWAMLFLSSRRLSGLTDAEIYGFLTHGPKGDPAIVHAVNNKLTNEYVKMMNLTFEWLSSLLPFTLQKINRCVTEQRARRCVLVRITCSQSFFCSLFQSCVRSSLR
jgi:hypothetical protein